MSFSFLSYLTIRRLCLVKSTCHKWQKMSESSIIERIRTLKFIVSLENSNAYIDGVHLSFPCKNYDAINKVFDFSPIEEEIPTYLQNFSDDCTWHVYFMCKSRRKNWKHMKDGDNDDLIFYNDNSSQSHNVGDLYVEWSTELQDSPSDSDTDEENKQICCKIKTIQLTTSRILTMIYQDWKRDEAEIPIQEIDAEKIKRLGTIVMERYGIVFNKVYQNSALPCLDFGDVITEKDILKVKSKFDQQERDADLSSLIDDKNSWYYSFALKSEISDYIDNGNVDKIPLLARMKAVDERKSELVSALSKSNIELRKDSKLCNAYITENSQMFTLEEIVTKMKDASFLHSKTDYGNRLRNAFERRRNEQREEYLNRSSSDDEGDDNYNDDNHTNYESDWQMRKRCKIESLKQVINVQGEVNIASELLTRVLADSV